jgi:hypothetical protein
VVPPPETAPVLLSDALWQAETSRSAANMLRYFARILETPYCDTVLLIGLAPRSDASKQPAADFFDLKTVKS